MQNTAKCCMMVLLLTTYSFSHAQVDRFFNTLKGKYNCAGQPGKPFKMVSDGALTTLLKRDFSFLVINRDQSSATAGTGFTLDFNTDKTQATYNFAVVNPFSEARNYSAPIWIFSGNVNAAYKAGVGSLFSNTKAGSSVGVLVKGSRILNKFLWWPATGPSQTDSTCYRVIPVTKAYIDYLIADYHAKKAKRDVAAAEKAKVALAIKTQRAKLNGTPDNDLLVHQELQKLNNELHQWEQLINAAAKDHPEYALYDTLINYELKNAPWNKQTITWVDGYLSANASKYKIFDDLVSHTTSDTVKAITTIGIALNQIQNGKNWLWYWKLGYKNSAATSMDALNTYTYENASVFDNGQERKSIGSSENAYKLSEAKSFTRFRQHVVEGETVIMFAKNSLGINLFADLGFNYKTELVTRTGVLNAGIGFIFTVFDQNKDKAKLNVEPFFKLTDINSQTVQSDSYATWERYQFGIKVGLPFNKVLL